MNFPLGEVASLGAAACWAIGLTLFRRDVRGIGARQVNLYKGLQGTALFLACLAFADLEPVPLEAQLFLAASGVVGLALGDTLLFKALDHLGPHRTALMGLLGPLLTAAGAWIFLGETLHGLQLLGCGLAMIGVTLVIWARPERMHAVTKRGVLYGVLAVACQAAGVVLTKRGLLDADPFTGSTIRIATATAVLVVLAALRRELGPDLARLFSAPTLRRLVPAVFFATFLGLWLMQTGIKHTESAVANALHSTTPLFTLPIVLFLLKERMGWLGIAGSFVGVGGVSLLLLS